MPNKIKYNATGTETDAIFVGNTAINVSQPNTGGGPSSVTGLYNAPAIPINGYAVYNNEVVFVANNDTDLINHLNNLGAGATTIEQALSWAVANSVTVVDRDYENVTTDGLVFSFDTSFIPSYSGYGSTLQDLSKNISSGTVSNGPVFNTDEKVFEFDGTNDQILFTGLPSETISEGSFFFWSTGGDTDPYSSPIGWHRINWSLRASQQYLYLGWGATERSIGFTNTGTSWRYLGVTISGGTATFYKDGQVLGTQSGFPTTTVSPSNVWIGRRNHSSGYWYNGKIGPCHVYHRALTREEIFQNFEAQKERFGFSKIVTEGLIMNLDANNPKSYQDGVSGTTWTNTVDVENSATLVNGVSYTNGSMFFDGSNSYATLGPDFGSVNGPELAYAILFYWDGVNMNRHLMGKRNASPYNQYNIGVRGGPNDASAGNRLSTFNAPDGGGGEFYAELSYALPSAGWYYGLVNIKTNRQELYVNGVLRASTNKNYTGKTFNIPGRNFYVGSVTSNDNGIFPPWNNKISVAQLYNRALTEEEIVQNFNAVRLNVGL